MLPMRSLGLDLRPAKTKVLEAIAPVEPHEVISISKPSWFKLLIRLHAQRTIFRRPAARRGKRRAAVAVARSLLIIIYHMLRDGTEYVELGGHYFDQLHEEQTERRLVKRLEQLGYAVTLQSLAA